VVLAALRATACPRPLLEGIPMGNRMADLGLFEALIFFTITVFVVDFSATADSFPLSSVFVSLKINQLYKYKTNSKTLAGYVFFFFFF
jgi:hypothetical protein